MGKMKMIVLAGALAAAACHGQAQSPPPELQGMAGQFANLLSDPESARFRESALYASSDGGFRSICGEYNAKNHMGGYAGFADLWVRLCAKRLAPVDPRAAG